MDTSGVMCGPLPSSQINQVVKAWLLVGELWAPVVQEGMYVLRVWLLLRVLSECDSTAWFV